MSEDNNADAQAPAAEDNNTDAQAPAAEDVDDKEEEKTVLSEKELEEQAARKKMLEGLMNRPAKPWPGHGLEEEVKNPPDYIEFKWDQGTRKVDQCDTKHALYLLQRALELVRKRTNQRNEYFKSIGREDRYINHLNVPKIMTNFLDWHNEDKDRNKFDGNLISKSDEMQLIEDYISKIGIVKLGPATRVYMKLAREVRISQFWFDLPQPVLRMKTRGYTKMYKGEKVIEDCNLEDVIKLLTYVNPDTDAEDRMQGILIQVEAKNKDKGSALLAVDDWKGKFVAFFRENKIDGNILTTRQNKQLLQQVLDYFVPPTDEEEKKKGNKLRGDVNKVLRGFKKVYVNGILKAYDAQQSK